LYILQSGEKILT